MLRSAGSALGLMTLSGCTEKPVGTVSDWFRIHMMEEAAKSCIANGRRAAEVASLHILAAE